jgi:hypothetical protein
MNKKIIEWLKIDQQLYDTIYNNILKYLHENPSNNQLNWLNRYFDSIFKYKVFIDAINESKYVELDLENKQVIRKTIRKFNPNAKEFIVNYYNEYYDTEILIIKMINSILD